MPELSLAELCSRGQSNGTHTIENGFQIENKIYTRDDAILIERAGYARTQVFQSTALAGSVTMGGEDKAPQIARPIMGVKAGMQYRVYAESYKAEWQGELQGWTANSCIFAPKTMKRVIEAERILCTKKVHVASDLCYSELIETRMQDRLVAGAINEGDTDFLNQVVLDTFIETNHINIDTHAFQGDYGASDGAISQVDGWFKKLVNATGTSQGQIIQYTFNGDLTGLAIMGQIGGDTFTVPFDTDSDTTVDNFITHLNGLYERRKGGRSLFKAITHPSSRVVVVEAWEGYAIVMDVVVGTETDGIYRCPVEHVIKAMTPPGDSGINVAAVETREAVTALSPIATELVSVRSDNVFSVLDDWYDLVNNTDSSMLQPNFGGNLLVARNVYNSYIRATHNHERSKHLSGNQGDRNLSVTDYMGLRMVPCNYMIDNTYMFARPNDLLVGVDLVNDVENFEVHRVPMTTKIEFHGAISIGFQVRHVNKVSGTFIDPTNSILVYEDEMPCDIVRSRIVAPPNL